MGVNDNFDDVGIPLGPTMRRVFRDEWDVDRRLAWLRGAQELAYATGWWNDELRWKDKDKAWKYGKQ